MSNRDDFFEGALDAGVAHPSRFVGDSHDSGMRESAFSLAGSKPSETDNNKVD